MVSDSPSLKNVLFLQPYGGTSQCCHNKQQVPHAKQSLLLLLAVCFDYVAPGSHAVQQPAVQILLTLVSGRQHNGQGVNPADRAKHQVKQLLCQYFMLPLLRWV